MGPDRECIQRKLLLGLGQHRGSDLLRRLLRWRVGLPPRDFPQPRLPRRRRRLVVFSVTRLEEQGRAGVVRCGQLRQNQYVPLLSYLFAT